MKEMNDQEFQGRNLQVGVGPLLLFAVCSTVHVSCQLANTEDTELSCAVLC